MVKPLQFCPVSAKVKVSGSNFFYFRVRAPFRARAMHKKDETAIG